MKPTSFDVVTIGRGAPMVLLAGAACDGSVWADTVAHYRSRYRLHVVELAGFAGRPPIDAPLLATSRRELCAYLAGCEGNPAIVVGHSLGAFLALALAIDAPARVAAVVAIDGVPALGRLSAPRSSVADVERTAAARRDRLARLSAPQFRRYLHSAFRAMVVAAERVDAIVERGSRSVPSAVAGAMYELWTSDLRPALSAIRAPVLFVAPEWPDVDPGRGAARLALYRQQLAGLRHLQEAIIPGARHFVMLDQPEALHHAMDVFLGQAPRIP